MIRQQVVGTKARRFYKLVACNQKDPQQGKHMEVGVASSQTFEVNRFTS